MLNRLTGVAALLAALLAQCLCTARAELSDVQLLADRVSAPSATTIYLNGTEVVGTNSIPAGAEYDNLVFVFDNPAASNSFTLDETVRADARILVVGGGGAGGTSKTTTLGCGGGGGGGGFVETTRELVGGTYAIAVGAGGLRYTGDEAVVAGEDGQPSSFDDITALGGGGGGAQSAGNNGGSGGGGSRSSTASSTPNGGVGEDGQGKNGGNGATAKFGAGGGGADAAGGNTTSTRGPGAGGKGLESDITGEAIFYAGGGGGGSASAMKSTGGKGGGGAGAYGGSSAKAAGDGEDGLGGGGGGGNDPFVGGKGGDGVVIVRITNLFESKVSVPVIADKTYNKNNQISLNFGNKYTYIDGVTNATVVGTYSFRVAPGTDCEWIAADGGGTAAKTVTWKIVAREIEPPSIVGGLVFTGAEQNGVTYTDDCASYCTFSAASVTNAVNADVYTYTVSLDDKANTIWKGGGTDDVSGTWTISPAKVTRPTPTALEFTYDNTEKSVFAASSLPELDTRYLLDSGDIKATEGGSYSFKFTLIGNDEATNYVWADSETDEPYEATWTIKPAANAITKFEVRGWKIGLAPNDPVLEATYGAETAQVTYGFGSNASTITTWLDDPRDIDKSGTWTARAVIPAKESWAGAEKTVTFDMWDDPADLYHDCVEISVKGTGTDVEEIPVPVRISSERMTGFSYDRVGSDGTGFLFVDEIGNILPYEVDTWDTSGESLVWLKLKSLPAAGISVTMYWNLISGKIAPADAVYSPTKVWSDYVGVWHLSETAAGAVVVKDASGHKDGTGHARSIVTNGLFCAARGRNEEKVNGPTMTVPRYNEMDALVNGSFTVSGWLMSTLDTPYYSYIFSRKSADNTPAWGAQWRGGGGNADMLAIYSSGNADNDNNRNVFNTQNVFLKNKWVKYDVVYEPTTVSLYIDGALVGTQAIKPTGGAKSGTLPFAVGGFTGDANNSTVHGFSDEVRLRSSAASAEWIAAEYTALSDSDLTSAGHVYHDGLKANKWIVYPELDKTEWDVNGEKGTFISEGETLYGEVTHVIYSVYDTTKTFDSPADITEPGLYRIDFTTTEIEDTETLEYTIDINVIESQPYEKIGGTNGDSGRILLMNRDANTKCPINYQGYDTTGKNNSTFWEHVDKAESTISLYNLQHGTKSILWTKNYGARLWHLVNCRHGNTVPEFGKVGGKNVNGVTDKDGNKIPATATTTVPLSPVQNYLPYSTTSYSIKSSLGARANPSTEGQVVMRNMGDTNDVSACAVVYSSCFNDGIGTIYFDAVNGWCRSSEDYENYKIVVEYATNTVYGTLPTDANSMTVTTEYDEDENPIVTTNFYGNITADQWHRAEMIPFIRDNTAEFERQDATNELALAVKTGGTMNNFYRVVVPLDISGPVRFRIRRVSKTEFSVDEGGFILLDNIIASIPADRADLESAGHFDAEKTGRQILGWELATSVPYPSKDDTGITGAAVPKYEVHSGDPETVDTSKFVASATMHYRWRYLNQDIGEWKSVDLNPSDGFRALSAFELPGRAGDVEYWFDYRLQAPFYSYVDYSGSGKAIDYTEERGTLTNRLDSAETLASGGRDWFFRLRDGRSKYAALDIVYKRAGSSVVEREHMALDGDGLWRGFVQTKENQTGLLTYRIEALDYQDAPFADYAATTNYWRCRVENPEFPVSDSLEEGTEESWSTLTLDAVTGHVMFQIDDRTNPKSITIVHADYQNFNGWSDARDRKGSDQTGKTVGPIFVGTSTTNEYKVGVSPSKQTFREDFSDWQTMPATNEYWMVPTYTDIRHLYGHAAYETFSSDTNGLWAIGQGMWVSKLYRQDADNSGVAIQMEGNGKGYLQFTDSTAAPRGLESVSFNARLGQFIKFDDFAYYYATPILNISNYTFVARTAFDLDANNGFSGNASLSVVAHYLPSKGAYEARWEWLGTNANTKRGQRLCLYKWTVLPSGVKKADLIIARTNTEFDVEAPTALANGATQRFTPLFISVTNDVANKCTWVVAGVRRCGVQLGTSPIGTTAANTSAGRNSNWLGVAFRDKTDTRLTRGTYGVLSANCPGYFARPEFSRTIQMPPDAAKPTEANPKTSFINQALTAVADLKEVKNCAADDLRDGEYPGWNIIPGRLKTTYADTSVNAIYSAPAAQNLKIFLGTPGRSDWGEAVTNIALTSFGSPTSPFVLPLYTTKDCSVRFEVDGTIEDVRTDIVIDSVVLKQWRGGDWNDDNTVNGVSKYLPAWAREENRRSVDAHTNFVFTSAWIKDNAVLLSAKRTEIDTPSSIRTPLMDDGGINRGLGLGMVSVEYANADENTWLWLQIATNNVSYSTVDSSDHKFDESIWTTVTNYNFAVEPLRSHLSRGTLNTYLGLHSVTGVARIVVATNAVAKVANVTDTKKFGEVTITKITCSDEPPVDIHSWWGWNMRTEGDDMDSKKRMYLADFPGSTGDTGLSLALNESVSATYSKSEIDVSDRESYLPHNPFLQTPTFTSNVVGEVVFKARKFSDHSEPAAVVLLGSMDASDKDEGTWSRLDGGIFYVTNTYYETYSYKTDPGRNYTAFRLAVMGVDDVKEGESGGGSGLPAGVDEPHRVLIDEMYVSEAVRTRMGFRNVGCFRGDPSLGTSLSSTTEVPGVPGEKMQPLCGESWGVQCEVYGAQLAGDIDFKGHQPRVRLHWYASDVPWGYEKWKDSPSAGSAWLSRATGTDEDRYVYRSSMKDSPAAVMSMSTLAPTYVQYMLEVEYYTVGSTKPVTNWMSAADWVIPEWYRPLDLNAQYGGGKDFAAYNILDNVAPGWAWINEVNIFGEFQRLFNSDADCQFVEIAHPPEADISGWTVRLLEPRQSDNAVVTNVLARFGDGGLAGTKAISSEDAAANMVFRVIANKATRQNGKVEARGGSVDAVWKVDNPTMVFSADGEISAYDPVAFQLVRTSGIVEHEIMVEGTNFMESLEIEAPDYLYRMRDWTTNRLVRSRMILPGYDMGGVDNSLSVTQNFGRCGMEQPTNDWTNGAVMTPGHLNAGQYIDPLHPMPAGEELLVYLTVTGEHIEQSIDGVNFTNGMVSVVVGKNSSVGTNVLYRTDPWYVLSSATTNAGSRRVSIMDLVSGTSATQPYVYTLSGVAKGIANNVTVNATAGLNPRLATEWGVPEGDPYRDAIVEWLKGGTDFYGNPFEDVESGEVKLAKFRALSGRVMSDLTLREMYWLDMDPTVGNLALIGGMVSAPGGGPVVDEHYVEWDSGEGSIMLTNRRVTVYMMITNENDVVKAPAVKRGPNDNVVNWTPYVLRGLAPGEGSQGYDSLKDDWGSVTFKITGMIMNGSESLDNESAKVPLRMFVFDENSFDSDGYSRIEVRDPYSTLSYGYMSGWWRQWEKDAEAGRPPSGVVYFWTIDTRLPQMGVEQLNKENYYGD